MRSFVAAFSVLLALSCPASLADTMFAPFVDSDGPNMLVWDTATGESNLFLFSSRWIEWDEGKQIPKNPLGVKPGGACMFAPYVDKDGKINVLAWSVTEGKSRLFIFDGESWMKWDDDKQIPPAPLDAGNYMFAAYRDKEGDDNFLVWNMNTGKSKFYVYQGGAMSAWDDDKQPPQNPLGTKQGQACMYAAYPDKDGDNLIAYDPATGESKMFVYSAGEWNSWKDEYQLPKTPVPVKPGENCAFLPYVDLNGDNNMTVVNTATGRSIFYIFSDGWTGWDDDKQMKTDPLPGRTGGRVVFAPMVDEDGDSLLVFEPLTARSRLYILASDGWSAWDDDKQLPGKPLDKRK